MNQKSTFESDGEWMEDIHSPSSARLRLLVFLQVPAEIDAAFRAAFVLLRRVGGMHFDKLQGNRFHRMLCAAVTRLLMRRQPNVLHLHFVVGLLGVAALPAQAERSLRDVV